MSRTRGLRALGGPARWALLAMVLLLLAGLAACADDSDTDDPAAADDEEGEQDADEGDADEGDADADGELAANQVLRFADDSEGVRAGLDPIIAPASPDLGIVRQLYNALVRFRPGDATEIEADLAEDWEISDDGLLYTFNLRQGVQFHHGYGELTAEDVVFSIERAADSEQSIWSAEFASIESVSAPDDYTVEITLSNRDAFLLQSLANVRGGLIVSKAAAEEHGEDYHRNPVGSGPFFLESHTEGQELVLAAHEDYWRGRPILDAIEMQFVPDATARRLALENREVLAARGQASQDWLDTVSDEIRVLEGNMGGRVLQFSLRVEPFDDPLVRQAVHHAYNPDEIAAFIGPDLVRSTPSVLPPEWVEYQDAEQQIPTYPYDPDRAMELLAEAGYPDGFTVPTVMTNRPESLETMEIIQDQLARVGIDVELQVVEHAAYREATDAGDNPLSIIGPRRDNPDLQLRVYYHSESEGSFNWSGYGIIDDDGIDGLLDDAARTLDDDERLQMYIDAQVKVMEDLPLIPIYHIQATPNASHPTFDYGYDIVTPPPGTYMYDITEQSRILAD